MKGIFSLRRSIEGLFVLASINLRDLTASNEEKLEALVRQTVQTGRQIDISSELRNTPNLLLMFDGLNEIDKELRLERRRLTQCFREYSHTLGDDKWVIIATRSHEAIGSGGGLAHHML